MAVDIEILICPSCKKELVLKNGLFCETCNTTYPIGNNKYYFANIKGVVTDKLDRIKHFLKQFSGLYNFLVTVISPVYIPFHLKRFLKKELENSSKVAINLGSGNSNVSKKINNVDLFDYPNVQIVCDISNLPLKDESVDLLVCVAVLEHVPNPQEIVEEIQRIIKPKGKIYIYIPFIQGYHASPHDYQRYTIGGMEHLFKGFNIVEIKCGSGPTSGFLWIFQEWLAILLSFGFKPLYRFLHLVIMGITFPLKFLDVLLIHHSYAKNIASGFTVIAEKE